MQLEKFKEIIETEMEKTDKVTMIGDNKFFNRDLMRSGQKALDSFVLDYDYPAKELTIALDVRSDKEAFLSVYVATPQGKRAFMDMIPFTAETFSTVIGMALDIAPNLKKLRDQMQKSQQLSKEPRPVVRA